MFNENIMYHFLAFFKERGDLVYLTGRVRGWGERQTPKPNKSNKGKLRWQRLKI